MGESVIKFKVEYDGYEILNSALISELSQWRNELYNIGLIGKKPERYGGMDMEM